MKKTLVITFSIIILALVSGITILYSNNNKLRDRISNLEDNEQAYIADLDNYKDKSKLYKFTIDQLEYSNDSLLNEMNKVRKELKIKDKDLKALQVLVSETSKKDTVFFSDTIFKSPKVKIDTTKKDDWYSLSLHLEYPNIVNTEVKFNNECYVVTSNRKETIKPPKKCFIARWFQKKHTVVEINVVEKNPYSINKQQKFIEIVK